MKEPERTAGKDDPVIVAVDESNLAQAAAVHAVSWQESHRSFCSPGFVAEHTPKRQKEYLKQKMAEGSRLFMLVNEEGPAGIVSVTGSLIADLYVLPDRQDRGYGTELLRFAEEQCMGAPTLWILRNNERAGRLYRKEGFRETGRFREGAAGIDEIEFTLPQGREEPVKDGADN